MEYSQHVNLMYFFNIIMLNSRNIFKHTRLEQKQTTVHIVIVSY